MTPDELRALADALEPMARAPRFEDFDVPGFCAWVRACADGKPVAIVGEQRNGAWAGTNTPVGYVWSPPSDNCTKMLFPLADLPLGTKLYTHPAPAAPQAEPCIGNDPICPCQDGDACHYKDSADGTKAWPVPQSEPKRKPACLWSHADDDTDVWETGCGHAFTIIDGTPGDNHMEFCCYCGRPLEQEIGDSDAE